MASKFPTDAAAVMARFQESYIPEPNSGCWLWIGNCNALGYGRFIIADRFYLAHRWLMTRIYGIIDEKMDVDHKCRVRCCVNPDHLEIVTHAENMRRAAPNISANNANRKKTHCLLGHPLFGANLYLLPNGNRGCRICRSHASEGYDARNRGKRRLAARAHKAKKRLLNGRT